MNRQNKTVKRKQKTSFRKLPMTYSGGGDDIAPIKITEVIDLILEIYGHPEYSIHLVEFFSDFQKEYVKTYDFATVQDDITEQKENVRTEQISLKKPESYIQTYVLNYFEEINKRGRSPYTHKENIQAFVNGKYFYKLMISNLVFIALNNLKKFITDTTSKTFNKTITTHILAIICYIITEIINHNLLQNPNTFFERLNQIIADKYKKIEETEDTTENNKALERIEKLLLQILYTLIYNIIQDDNVKKLYISIIHDNFNKTKGDGKSINEIIKKWQINILCYLKHSKDFVDLLIDDDIIVLITHYIGNSKVSSYSTLFKIIFGKFFSCNAELIKQNIGEYFGWKKQDINIDEEEKQQFLDEVNEMQKLPGQLERRVSLTSFPSASTKITTLQPNTNNNTRKKRKGVIHWANKRFNPFYISKQVPKEGV
jgi:hypothetical protein